MRFDELLRLARMDKCAMRPETVTQVALRAMKQPGGQKRVRDWLSEMPWPFKLRGMHGSYNRHGKTGPTRMGFLGSEGPEKALEKMKRSAQRGWAHGAVDQRRAELGLRVHGGL